MWVGFYSAKNQGSLGAHVLVVRAMFCHYHSGLASAVARFTSSRTNYYFILPTTYCPYHSGLASVVTRFT